MKKCCPPSCCARIKSLAIAVADLQYILKEIQDEQDEALCALGKTDNIGP